MQNEHFVGPQRPRQQGIAGGFGHNSRTGRRGRAAPDRYGPGSLAAHAGPVEEEGARATWRNLAEPQTIRSPSGAGLIIRFSSKAATAIAIALVLQVPEGVKPGEPFPVVLRRGEGSSWLQTLSAELLLPTPQITEFEN